MELNIYNWQVLKQYFPSIFFSKKDLQDILFKQISQHDLSDVKDTKEIDSINVVFISSGEIKQLNKDFRKKDVVTDVLSFVIEEEDPLVGEVYICPEYVAKKYDYKEILRDIVHGFLHLLGEEHSKHFTGDNLPKEEMFVKQENMLQNILYEINNRAG